MNLQDWCITDGADLNRQFIKIHFKGKDPADCKFVAHNKYTGDPILPYFTHNGLGGSFFILFSQEKPSTY